MRRRRVIVRREGSPAVDRYEIHEPGGCLRHLGGCLIEIIVLLAVIVVGSILIGQWIIDQQR